MLLSPKIESEMSRVNWDKTSTVEVAGFFLAMNLYNDQANKVALWRASWQTALGGVISMSVLTLVILLMKLTPATALEAIIVTQCLRTLWLFRKTVKAAKDARSLESDVIITLDELSVVNPVDGR